MGKEGRTRAFSNGSAGEGKGTEKETKQRRGGTDKFLVSWNSRNFHRLRKGVQRKREKKIST